MGEDSGHAIEADHDAADETMEHGEDTVEAGHGEDAMEAEHGDDTMEAEHGEDTTEAEHGEDTMEAEHGDTVEAECGEDEGCDPAVDGEAFDEAVVEGMLLEAEDLASRALEGSGLKSLEASAPDNIETQVAMEMNDNAPDPDVCKLPAPLGSFDSQQTSLLGPGASCGSLVAKTENLSLEDCRACRLCHGMFGLEFEDAILIGSVHQ